MKKSRLTSILFKWMNIFFLTLFIFTGCRKEYNVKQDTNLTYQELKSKFFNTRATRDLEIKKLAADIQKQDSVYKFLPDFVRKNGLPKWDKVIYQTSKNSNVNRKSSTSNTNANVSSIVNTSQSNDDAEQGIFLIPLQSQTSQEILSYITAYKHNDSLYTYRLYNKDSLSNVQAGSTVTQQNLINTQAVFGYFEKFINNTDSINITSPENAIIKNVNISFGNGSFSQANNILSTTSSSSLDCTLTISITIEYTIEVWSDGNTTVIQETLVYTLEVTITCTGGGGGGCGCGGTTSGGTTGGTTSGGGSPSGGGNYDPSGGGWWTYGTGWPYYTGGGSGGNGSGPYDPNWYWWWTKIDGTFQIDEQGDDNSNSDDISTVDGNPIEGFSTNPDINGDYYDIDGNQLDNTFKIQNNIINTWKGTNIQNGTNLQKGNFGEIASDVALQLKGYTPLHNRITDINNPTHLGIDAVFKTTVGGVTKYYIVEAKWGNKSTDNNTVPRQMSDAWINGRLQGHTRTRLQEAVGDATAATIGTSYIRLLANVDANGNVKYTMLDSNGQTIPPPNGIFVP